MRKNTLQKKMLYINTTLVVALMSLIFCIVISLVLFYQRKQFENILEDTSVAVVNTVNSMIDYADEVAIQLAFNPQYMEKFKQLKGNKDQTNYFTNEPIISMELMKYMLPYLVKYNNISRICVYNENGDFLISGLSINKKDMSTYLSYTRLNDLREFFCATNHNVKYEVHPQDDLYQINTSTNVNQEGYLSILRPLTDYENKEEEPIAYIEVQIPLLGLKKNLDYKDDLTEIILLDKKQPFFKIGELNNYANPYSITTLCAHHNLSIKVRKANSGQNKVIIGIILLVALFLGLFAYIVIRIQYLAIQKITNPLTELCSKVQHITITENGEFDEIKTLNKSFNHMIDRLQLGIQKLLTAKESELNAQMLALQAQVNPHFIHNTLSIIISLIEEGCNDKAKEVIIKLSQMIRYSSDYRDKQVSLKQEIHYIKDYMDLLKVRYEEDFSYKIIEENNMENQIIPKYILQPLVENALQHSLKLSDYPWEIQISCYKTATSWYISIQDNGKRIEKEKVKELKAYVDQISTCDMKDLLSQLRIGGYSLINTIIRMYITYGESMIFDIFSNQQGGTTVVIGGGLKDDQGISG